MEERAGGGGTRFLVLEGLRMLLLKRVAGAAVLAMATLLTGCGAFFVCQKASCPTTPVTGDGSDYGYVANSATGSTYINGYALSSGTLVATTSSPYSLDYVPQAMTITPSDAYLYIATDSAVNGNIGYLYGYSIGTGGALTILDSGTALVADDVVALDVSPDGKWLFALNANIATQTATTISEYSIDSTTGALTFAASYSPSSVNSANAIINPLSIKVAPSGDFFVCAMGTGGAQIYSFDTTTGIGTSAGAINPNLATGGVNAIAIDANNYLYAAGILAAGGKPGLQVFSVTSAGLATAVGSTYAVGNGPNAIAVSTKSAYVYVANGTDSTISAFSIATGVLTPLNSGTAYTAPTNIGALAADQSGKYLLAAGFSATSGNQIFSISSTGTLTESGSAGSGATATIPATLAVTH